jgi:HAD superfamily hydrolase (TIGR01450 family)
MRKVYLVDIEGTIVKDKSYAPIEGAVEWINSFSSSAHHLVLLSNNTTHKPRDLVSLLNSKGFDVQGENLVTCISAAVNWLKTQPVRSCFVIGNPQLKEYLNESGIETPSHQRVEAVLVGLDPSLTYDKLKVALNALVKRDAHLLALHANRLYQDEQGELSPSVGPVVKALEYGSQKEAKVFGKPNPEIYREAISKFDIEIENCFMVSDDPLSDLVGAQALGMKTVFVTSGKYKDKEILKSLSEESQPDWVHQSVREIRI